MYITCLDVEGVFSTGDLGRICGSKRYPGA